MKTETITRALKLATSSQLASELASRSTPAKAKAARENGKKGGWPKGRPRKPKDVTNCASCEHPLSIHVKGECGANTLEGSCNCEHLCDAVFVERWALSGAIAAERQDVTRPCILPRNHGGEHVSLDRLKWEKTFGRTANLSIRARSSI